MEPVSHFFYSHRLKLQFWDFGGEGKPSLVLVHGGLDHARNWDWVARDLCRDYHVYALDLRGHGNAPGLRAPCTRSPSTCSTFGPARRHRRISHLPDRTFPGRRPGHALRGDYPDRVRKVVNIEGLGFPAGHRIHAPYSERLRRWVEQMRETEKREPRPYPDIRSAISRMKEANPHLSDEQARHLTLHGTNWNSDGSLIWKFDNYARAFPPYGHNLDDIREIVGRITCPVLLFWGMESRMPDPEADGRLAWVPNVRLIRVPQPATGYITISSRFFLRKRGSSSPSPKASGSQSEDCLLRRTLRERRWPEYRPCFYRLHWRPHRQRHVAVFHNDVNGRQSGKRVPDRTEPIDGAISCQPDLVVLRRQRQTLMLFTTRSTPSIRLLRSRHRISESGESHHRTT